MIYDEVKDILDIELVHIFSHTGKLDPLSIGNDIADKIASRKLRNLQHIKFKYNYINVNN